jgi:hypothetical protein
MGCSVPQDRRLLWPYPSFCTPPRGLMIISAWSCACAPAAEVPQFTLPVLCDVPSSVLRWFQQVHLTISSLPMLSSQQLQGARQPRVPRQSRTNGVSSRSCNVRFMLRPARSACPALVRTFTSELSPVGSPPKPASDITSWLIVYYHGRIFPGRTGSLMGCNGVWTFLSSRPEACAILGGGTAPVRSSFVPFALKRACLTVLISPRDIAHCRRHRTSPIDARTLPGRSPVCDAPLD